MTSELKPCPFCGREATLSHMGSGCYRAHCSCNSGWGTYSCKEHSVDAWNTRATPSVDPLAGVVRYRAGIHSRGYEDEAGEYVLHSEVAKIIAGSIEEERQSSAAFLSEYQSHEHTKKELGHWKDEATRQKQCVEQLQAELTQIKAQNERFQDALTKIASFTQSTELLWWKVEARAALKGDSNDKG